MKKKSTMLVVMSIINTILGAIGIIAIIFFLRVLSSFGVGIFDVDVIETLGYGQVFPGTIAVSIVLVLLLLASGIFGLACRSKKAIAILGIIMIILTIVSVILNIASSGYFVVPLIALVPTVLYLIGALQCVE